jgi:exopolyphosphatase/guanosine-5'-triphosphate,3'-diphosphate pyrophosphatase
MRLGIIDCGTNTFHLLIAEVKPDGSYETVFRERSYVLIGEEGVTQLGEQPQKRGIETLKNFRRKMEEMAVDKWRAFGTEALRRAGNSQSFIDKVREETGINIEIISGDEEARLIHLGVMQAVPPFAGKALIMDVGGGSVEFIIADAEKVYWAQSFPIGVQVLYSDFQRNDPISQGDIIAIEMHLESVLQPLAEQLKIHQTPLLIGASGTFEVVESMLRLDKPSPLYGIVDIEAFRSLCRKVLPATEAERLRMEGLPKERVKLISVALKLVDYTSKLANVRQIITSVFAMKEGMLKEEIDAALGK